MSSNKFVFDLLHIETPLLCTFIHFSITAVVLALVRVWWPDIIPPIAITRSQYLRWVVPVALTTALDVGLSNMAYSRLPISIMTVLKSSAVVCIYTAGVFWGVEQLRWNISLVCIVIATSIGLATPGSSGEYMADSKFISGVAMICVAVISLSIRWVLVQSLTKRFTALQLMYLIQPTSALILVPFASMLEINSDLFRFLSSNSVWIPMLLVFGSAFVAMFLLLSEYQIVHLTSSLTLSIAGIGKEILTLSLSVVLFGETFTLRQALAISVSILAIFVYGLLRSREQPVDHRMEEFELAAVTESSPNGGLSPMSE